MIRDAERQLRATQAKIDNSSVKHTIEQEMARLLQWKNNPEALKGQATGKPVKDVNGDWQVPCVSLPVKGDDEGAVAGKDSIVVTYSEINTMPDFFGNPETIANTRKKKVLHLLQGVREQSYTELNKLYKEIFGTDFSDKPLKEPKAQRVKPGSIKCMRYAQKAGLTPKPSLSPTAAVIHKA
ncbi:MAG: hypothetical protein IVW55_09955 [Chloroflexi bacterium]|nr:hypothetical protein [Chloroflexota bacterium]